MNVLVVSCHPLEESFSAYVRARALRVLSASHDVRHLDLYAEEEGLERAGQLAWADALVLMYPTWWSSLPAPLLDWIDNCWSARHRYPNLRKIVAVTTHGSSWPINFVEGEVGRRVVMRGLGHRAHRRCRRRWISLYNLDRSTEARRRQFVEKVERQLAGLA
jgi:putative NADPH-quinone reductase